MLRLGFGACRSLLLLVARSCNSAFLVKYCVRYFGTRLFKHLKTRMHLTSLAHKVSFEVFVRYIIRAARFCRRCNSLQHPSEIMAARVKCIPV